MSITGTATALAVLGAAALWGLARPVAEWASSATTAADLVRASEPPTCPPCATVVCPALSCPAPQSSPRPRWKTGALQGKRDVVLDATDDSPVPLLAAAGGIGLVVGVAATAIGSRRAAVPARAPEAEEPNPWAGLSVFDDALAAPAARRAPGRKRAAVGPK